MIEVDRFSWTIGEDFTAALWLCNDSDQPVTAQVNAEIDYGDGVRHWFATACLTAEPRSNAHADPVSIRIPSTAARRFTVCLTANTGGELTENRYTFACAAERI